MYYYYYYVLSSCLFIYYYDWCMQRYSLWIISKLLSCWLFRSFLSSSSTNGTSAIQAGRRSINGRSDRSCGGVPPPHSVQFIPGLPEVPFKQYPWCGCYVPSCTSRCVRSIGRTTQTRSRTLTSQYHGVVTECCGPREHRASHVHGVLEEKLFLRIASSTAPSSLDWEYSVP